MKEGWKYERLGDICDILDSKRKPITKDKRVIGSIPYYGATGVLDYVKDFIFDEKLVLLGEDGAKWGAGDNSAYIITGKSWVNNHAHTLRPHRNIVIDEYLTYYLNFSDLLGYITGVTVPKLNQEKMRGIEIPIPPISEQERIVSLLDAQFAKIDAIKANAEKQLKEAKALFQSALKDYLTPKEGWKYESFCNVFPIRMGKTPPRADKEMWDANKKTKNLWVSVADITSNEGQDIISTKEHISELAAQKMPIVPKGYLLMSFKLTIGKMAFAGNDLYTNEAIIAIPKNEKYDLRFLYYYLSSYNWDTLTTGAEKVKGKTLNKSSISKIQLPIIPLSEQHQIAEQLDKISAKIQSLQSNFDTTITLCNDLKQSILKDIFG